LLSVLFFVHGEGKITVTRLSEYGNDNDGVVGNGKVESNASVVVVVAIKGWSI
jgi:hypothetical protein